MPWKVGLLCLVLALTANCAGPPLPRPAEPAVASGPSWPLSWKAFRKANRKARPLVRSRGARPGWTCTLPTIPGLLALGYSGPWVYPGETLLHACRRGLDHLTRSVVADVRTSAAVLTWQYWEQGFFEKEVSVPEGQERRVAGAARVLDTWLDPETGSGWCLVGLPGSTDPAGARRIAGEAGCGLRPRWMDELPLEPGALYAIGSSEAWAEEWRGIEYAEEDALGELSRILGARVEGSMIRIGRLGEAGIHQLRKVESRAVLAGSQIVAWWRAPGTGEWFTLARLPLAPVQVSLAPLLAGEGETPEESGTLLENAEAHHRRMEKVLEALEWE